MNHTKRFMELLEISAINIPVAAEQNGMKIIHVAGTNGKGSTCAYMNEILCGIGETVGLFTSPHLEEMTERIRINGEEIGQDEFVTTFHQVMDVVECMKREGLPHPTFFEFLLGMGMKAFTNHELSYVILETGLGGRLDATNVFERPAATVITSIGLDHQQYLGNSIEEIAGEKAGIIKKNVPVVFDGENAFVREVIQKKAKELNCLCRNVSDFAYEIQEKNGKYIAFYLNDRYDESAFEQLESANLTEDIQGQKVLWKIKNRGTYQVSNAALALYTLQILLHVDMKNSLDIDWEQIENKQPLDIWKHALYQTEWEGRMEEIEPNVFVDGAHNIPAIEAIVKDWKCADVLLFSAVSDKNYKSMIEILTKEIEVKAYVVTTIEGERGVPAKELGEIISQYVEKPVYVEETVEAAFKQAKTLKSKEGKILCLGSLYLVGMLKHVIAKERKDEPC